MKQTQVFISIENLVLARDYLLEKNVRDVSFLVIQSIINSADGREEVAIAQFQNDIVSPVIRMVYIASAEVKDAANIKSSTRIKEIERITDKNIAFSGFRSEELTRVLSNNYGSLVHKSMRGDTDLLITRIKTATRKVEKATSQGMDILKLQELNVMIGKPEEYTWDKNI